MKIVIFDGTFKTTTFINRLIEGLANEHKVFVLGFNENTKTKIADVHYIGLGSNTSTITFIIRSLQLRGFNIVMQCKLFLQLFNREKNAIRNENIQMELSLVTTCMIQRDNILNVHHYHQQMPMHHHIMYP